MDAALRRRLHDFLLPLYQDVDGVSRFPEVERVATIARRLYTPADESDARAFELLLLFHLLGPWLDKVGHLSRARLTLEIDESELRRTAQSIRRLDEPVTAAERAVAAALLIDGAGVRGLIDLFLRARREGSSVMDVVRAAMSDMFVPQWFPPHAAAWLHARREARREVCRRMFEELALDDLV